MSRCFLVLVVGGLLLPGRSFADADRFTGLWEGTFHAERGDQPVALVCRPRGPIGVTGMVYLEGAEFGPIDGGQAHGDSLTFWATGYAFRGALEGARLHVDLVIPHGRTHPFDVTRTSADTTSLPASVREKAAEPAAAPLLRDIAPDSVYRAHVVPASTVSSTHPCLRNGTLLLVGGGPGQADIDARFRRLAGGDGARLVSIPTASIESADSTELERFRVTTARIYGQKDVALLHTFSRKAADSDAFVRPLRRATGVWMTGGEGSYLIDSYLGTRTERELIALLDRGGVIGGTSAGAVIWGSRMMTFRARPGAKAYEQMRPEDQVLGNVRETGIGLLRNVVVVAHFTEFHLAAALQKLVAAYPGILGIGIDEATAVEVHGDVCTVMGRGSVTVLDGRDHGGTAPLILKDGARYDLARRVVL